MTTRRERKFVGALDRLRGINNILGRDAVVGLEMFRALISGNAYSGMDLWSATFPVKPIFYSRPPKSATESP